MELSLFQPGRELRIEYPSHNRLDLPLEYVERRILVSEVRDCRGCPLAVESLLRRPLVRRGSILILAEDLDIGGPVRKFWFEAIRGAGELPAYRLGAFAPDEPSESVEWIGRPFAATAEDRRAMQEVLNRFLGSLQDRPGLSFGVFPVLPSAP